MNPDSFLQTYQLSLILLTFLISFYIIFLIKPNFVFTPKGTFREFGLGFSKKTVIPMWLVTIFIAIMSYLLIRFISIFSKIKSK